MAIDLKVFTLNCWGLRGISKNRKTRINAIAEVLSKKDYDVICLQEVWMDKDYQTIKLKLEEVLPYSHYFYSGVVGSGVCIFSKHFIEEAFFHHWSVNGYIHKLHHGDWWAGKGVGLCRLKIETDECNYHVNIYSAHLHAEYNRATDDYLAHRILQAYDTAQFILLTSGTADLVVLAGDLNTEPDDLAYRIILNVPGLTDSYLKANNTDQDGFATCESYLNSYTNSAAIRNRELGKRIDYVLYHPGSNVRVDFKSYSLPLPARIPQQCFSFSDHEAILVEFKISKQGTPNRDLPDLNSKKIVLEKSIFLCQKALKSIKRTQYLYWLGVCLSLMLLVGSLILPATRIDFVVENIRPVLSVLLVIFTISTIFCVLMATIWTRIEKHGVLSGILAMEKSLRVLIHE